MVIKFANKGQAIPVNGKFSYVDVWSSIYSWGGTTLPKTGELVFFNNGICSLETKLL